MTDEPPARLTIDLSRRSLLDRMNTYFQETRNGFQGVLDWLNQWACARSYGLGSKLPWDPQFLVESLSDSTVYMAYYTVSQFLQGKRRCADVTVTSRLTDPSVT
jgi:leucyl-tRNA synthetase